MTSERDFKHTTYAQGLVHLREIAGLSQDEMGHLTGMDPLAIVEIETGERKPPRYVGFYDRLRQAISPNGQPIFEVRDIRFLLSTSDAPKWLVRDQKLDK